MEAAKYNVFPLDNSVLTRLLAPQPSATAGRDVFTYSGEMPGLPYSDAPDLLNKSYTITAYLTIPQGWRGRNVGHDGWAPRAACSCWAGPYGASEHNKNTAEFPWPHRTSTDAY